MTSLQFDVVKAAAHPSAAAPTIVFSVRISRTEPGPTVHALALRATLQIDTRHRRYSPTEQRRLYEVFGPPDIWDRTVKPLMWAHATTLVGAFDRTIEVEIPVACTYDFEVASAKYLHAVRDGDIPLEWLFSGTMFFAGERGFSVAPVAWDSQATSTIPARLWRDTVDRHFPHGAWIRIDRDTLDALHEYRARRADADWDRTLMALLDAVTNPANLVNVKP